MTVLALSFIGKGPRNFFVKKDIPVSTNNAIATITALPPTKDALDQKDDGKNNNNINGPEHVGVMTLI